MLRVNLSIAIVAMVKPHNKTMKNETYIESECVAEDISQYTNGTSVSHKTDSDYQVLLMLIVFIDLLCTKVLYWGVKFGWKKIVDNKVNVYNMKYLTKYYDFVSYYIKKNIKDELNSFIFQHHWQLRPNSGREGRDLDHL